MRFKVWFEKLSILQKGELYGIVIAFFLISYLLLEKDLTTEPVTSHTVTIEPKKILQTTKSLPYIETLLEENHLFLHSIYNHNEHMTLEFEGDFLSVITFLKQLQTITKIVEFELGVENEMLKSKLVIENKKTFPLVKSVSMQKICNPFVLPVEIQEKSFHLEAIINQKVMISGEWYSKNDLLENYQIKTIGKDFVVLVDTNLNKDFQIRLFDEP